MGKIAILGAGLSGAVLASQLKAAGLEVCVFEKSRGPGGRLAHRRTQWGRVQHGAVEIHGSNPRFLELLQSVEGLEESTVERVRVSGNGQVQPAFQISDDAQGFQSHRLRAKGGLNAICKSLLEGIEVHYETKVESIRSRFLRKPELISMDERSLGSYATIVSTAPPTQTAALYGESVGYSSRIQELEFHPLHIFVGVVEAADPAWPVFDVLDVTTGSLMQIQKQNLDQAVALVATATVETSRQGLERDREVVGLQMQKAVEAVLGEQDFLHTFEHRWRYARALRGAGQEFFREGRLFAVGDWCLGSSAEHAFLSASAAAKEILRENRRLL